MKKQFNKIELPQSLNQIFPIKVRFEGSVLNIGRQSVTVDELNLEIKQAKSIINKIS